MSKPLYEVTDSVSLRKVGNAIADELGIRRPTRWIFRIKKGQDHIEGRINKYGVLYFLHGVAPFMKYKVVIIQGTEPYVVENQELIDWYWANNALKVKIGDKVVPDQEMIKRVIIHELMHARQIDEGEETNHGPKFSKMVQEAIVRCKMFTFV